MTYNIYPSLTILLSLTFSYAAFGADQVFLNKDEIKEIHSPITLLSPDALSVLEEIQISTRNMFITTSTHLYPSTYYVHGNPLNL